MNIINDILHQWASIMLAVFFFLFVFLVIKWIFIKVEFDRKKRQIQIGSTFVWIQLEDDPFKETTFTYAEILDHKDDYVSFISLGEEMSSTTAKFLSRFEPYNEQYIQ